MPSCTSRCHKTWPCNSINAISSPHWLFSIFAHHFWCPTTPETTHTGQLFFPIFCPRCHTQHCRPPCLCLWMQWKVMPSTSSLFVVFPFLDVSAGFFRTLTASAPCSLMVVFWRIQCPPTMFESCTSSPTVCCCRPPYLWMQRCATLQHLLLTLSMIFWGDTHYQQP